MNYLVSIGAVCHYLIDIFIVLLSNDIVEDSVRDTITSKRVFLYGLSLVLIVGLVAAPTTAQEASPSVILSDATIAIDADKASTVDATYTLTVDSIGTGDAALQAVTGTLWLTGSYSVQDIAATVDGEPVSADVAENGQYMDVTIPLEDVQSGDTITVGLTYTVTGTAGQLKAPLWVPEYQTTGDDASIDVAVTLPDGQEVHGASFPKINSQDGNTLSYELLHMPGLVTFAYGAGSGGIFNLDSIASAAGLILIVGFLGSWVAWTRGYLTGGKNVA